MIKYKERIKNGILKINSNNTISHEKKKRKNEPVRTISWEVEPTNNKKLKLTHSYPSTIKKDINNKGIISYEVKTDSKGTKMQKEINLLESLFASKKSLDKITGQKIERTKEGLGVLKEAYTRTGFPELALPEEFDNIIKNVDSEQARDSSFYKTKGDKKLLGETSVVRNKKYLFNSLISKSKQMPYYIEKKIDEAFICSFGTDLFEGEDFSIQDKLRSTSCDWINLCIETYFEKKIQWQSSQSIRVGFTNCVNFLIEINNCFGFDPKIKQSIEKSFLKLLQVYLKSKAWKIDTSTVYFDKEYLPFVNRIIYNCEDKEMARAIGQAYENLNPNSNYRARVLLLDSLKSNWKIFATLLLVVMFILK